MDSSVATMIHAVRGYIRIADIGELIPSDPAINARIPQVHADESRTHRLDRLLLSECGTPRPPTPSTPQYPYATLKFSPATPTQNHRAVRPAPGQPRPTPSPLLTAYIANEGIVHMSECHLSCPVWPSG